MKSFGVQPYLFPMPVLMIATYSENEQVNVMNMAWGGICGENKVALNISAGHKTAQNLKARGAFTISVADVAHMAAADFLGTASGNITIGMCVGMSMGIAIGSMIDARNRKKAEENAQSEEEKTE